MSGSHIEPELPAHLSFGWTEKQLWGCDGHMTVCEVQCVADFDELASVSEPSFALHPQSPLAVPAWKPQVAQEPCQELDS